MDLITSTFVCLINKVMCKFKLNCHISLNYFKNQTNFASYCRCPESHTRARSVYLNKEQIICFQNNTNSNSLLISLPFNVFMSYFDSHFQKVGQKTIKYFFSCERNRTTSANNLRNYLFPDKKYSVSLLMLKEWHVSCPKGKRFSVSQTLKEHCPVLLMSW